MLKSKNTSNEARRSLATIDEMRRSRIICALFLAFHFLGRDAVLAAAQGSNASSATVGRSPVNVSIGVILDLHSTVGRLGLSCISMALSDLYTSNSSYSTRILLHTRDSKRDVVTAAASALDLIKNEQVQAIIGQSTTMEAVFMANLGARVQVPVISFSATGSSISHKNNPFFIRAAQNDSSQAESISAIVKSFGWKEAVPVYIDNEFGNSFIPYLTDALQNVDARVPYRSVIPEHATDEDIVLELYKMMSMQTRVFIVHLSSLLGSRFFLKVKEVGMLSEGYVWILTSGITDLLSSIDPSVVESSMQGLLGVKTYVPETKELRDFIHRWRIKFFVENQNATDVKMNVFGLWAYDAATLLGMATEATRITDLRFNKANHSGIQSDFESLGVSVNGPKLLHQILNTKFTGLSGNFKLVNGERPSSYYQIVNIIGSGGRPIGFWSSWGGITRELTSNTHVYSTNSSNLRPVIWPGDLTAPPKGWTIPTSGKRLKIGVPVKVGFTEFVNVPGDPNNKTKPTGYCVDVFDAVMGSLPYAVPYDFVPYQKPNGKSAGTYDDLLYQVYTQKYDAVMGDTTIIANRSKYVDFTLPYTDSGVSMIVPIRDHTEKNAWVFLKPLTWQLWTTSFFFFIFTGFVIWVLEHRINEEFRGPPTHQIGTIFYFSFSTMVFAHREKVISNAGRFVVVLWIFVVLILTQSYTASLTSMLTVQQLQPTVTDIDQLLKSNAGIGYQKDSFVFGLLKQMKFHESRLISFNSSENLHDAFNKGSSSGGISAAFDEIPYMKLFLAKYCSMYTMVQPTYKTDGFGFAFPLGSPLVSDVSRAVLSVIEGGKMWEIEEFYFKKGNCPAEASQISASNLSLESFWGLFLIAGIASFLALLIFIAMFLHEHKNIWMCPPPEHTSLGQRISRVMRVFNQKDYSSHTFRSSHVQDANIV